jgi:ubiquinone/menaquinone biosynthesis C-methylase UbiE
VNKKMVTVAEYYEVFEEVERLTAGLGKLEFERTQSLLRRFLPAPPAVVLDVGGGTGPYSRWLAKSGYTVHLVEPSAKLLAQARNLAEKKRQTPLFHCHQGDARSLDFPDRFADAVLLFGPLYHLTAKAERLRALRESRRVLKKTGRIFAAAISRFASAVDGLAREFFKESVFFDIIVQDLADGRHGNPTDRVEFFTDSYFHRPSELKTEIESAGFSSCRIFPVEGLGVFLPNFDAVWAQPRLRKRLLAIVERTENEPDILGVSPHLFAVAWSRPAHPSR